MEERAVGGRGGLLAGLAVALLVLAPLLVRRGFVLSYDMVFVPDPALDGRLLGLGPALARAVPSDLLVALPSQLLPAELVQRLVLVLALAGGAWGAGRLVPGGLLPGAVAGVAYAWTAATAERLVLGQWALLVSLGALPWVVGAALRGRGLLLPLAAAACGSPAGGLLAGAVAVGLQRRLVDVARVAGLALLVCLPWALPSVLRPGGVPGDPAGLAAFAPRADTPLGTVGSVLTLGGVWNAQVVPPGRDALVAVLGLGLLVVAAYGLRSDPRLVRLLGPVAAVGLLVALAPVLPGLDRLAEVAVERLPGGGLLRDGQKYAAPYALLVALGLGRAAAQAPRRLGVLLLAAPVALLPSLAWGVSGRLSPVDYPAGTPEVRRLVASGPGAVLSLPWTAYRRPTWNGGRTVLDPLPRLLDRQVVVDDDLVLPDRTVQGEDPVAARLDPVVSGSGGLTGPLAAAGVGWVVLARGEPGAPDPAPRLVGAALRLDGPAWQVWQLPVVEPADSPGPPVAPVVLADTALALLVLLQVARAAATVVRTSPHLEELDP